MNVRETAEQHGSNVAEGNMQAAMADFTPEALEAFRASGLRPPRGRYELLSERREDDRYVFEIRYGDNREALTVRSTWARVGDAWKIVAAEPVR